MKHKPSKPDKQPKPAAIPTEITLVELLWLVLSITCWFTAIVAMCFVSCGVASLFVDLPAMRLNNNAVTTFLDSLVWLAYTIPLLGIAGIFVWLQLIGRLPSAFPKPYANRPGPTGLRRIPWYFVSFNAPVGAIRIVAIVSLRGFGILAIVLSPFWWTADRNFKQDGITTNDVVVVANRTELDGDRNALVIDYEYRDIEGRFHKHTYQEPNAFDLDRNLFWSDVKSGDLTVGGKLPEIEYLRSEPARHRFVCQRRESWQWWRYPLPGLAMLTLAAVVVWSADWFPSDPSEAIEWTGEHSGGW